MPAITKISTITKVPADTSIWVQNGLPKRGPKTAFKKRGYRRGPGDNPGYNIGISFLCHLSVIQSVSFPYESHSLVL
jgi:hypothetical protein